MKLPAYIFLTTLLAAIQCVIAAPAVLERRGPRSTCPISSNRDALSLQRRTFKSRFRETGKDTAHWHFGLIIHAPGAITGSAQPVNEHVVDADAKFVNSFHSYFQTALRKKVKELVSSVAGASKESIGSGNFNNCFDFAVEAVRRLGVANYVSAADYQKFKAHHDRYAAAVKAKTDAATMALCKRGNTKGCTPKAKPGANGRTAAPKVVPKPEAKPAGKPAPKKRQ
ncbi:hypothetical protein Hypma_014000 [Hypsizygus marmoreus]|uniref:Uncharacterized protein n=1 Tax=Hypsizygus marmoreus TaxID=39966 RepID=A0A369K659_HYPMA|nr:hypothetical protein Hypma_014000 [Hypsizygus marmoreus]